MCRPPVKFPQSSLNKLTVGFSRRQKKGSELTIDTGEGDSRLPRKNLAGLVWITMALLLGACLCVMFAPRTFAQQHCNMSFENHTRMQLTMYVDGHNGCLANAGMTCSSTENLSAHHVDARSGEQIVHRLAQTVPAGTTSFTYVVCYTSDNNPPCQGAN